MHLKLRGERDVIRLRNPTEDKMAFRRMLTSADLVAAASLAPSCEQFWNTKSTGKDRQNVGISL